ncbi:MAG TPA: class I SAM-dependent methyltransferase [Candidatus Eisenbacteria bacterium]|nr:class I SAM-dependent methyltransferase [Candidatus Eisenbacteria bacterium]
MTKPSNDPAGAAPREVVDYYGRYPEEARLERGPFRLEFERTKEIFRRLLPPAPAQVIDVGGAAGAYSAHLAALGYEVHLVDLSPRLVEEARRRNEGAARPIASFAVADARRLPQGDATADAVLVMGPLYHLPEPADRLAALREAHRVLRAPGIVLVAAISRYASALDGMARGLARDPQFVAIRDRDLVDGQHRNETGHEHYFTTAYFHRPEDLRAEIEAAGFGDASILGVEGPGWLAPDFDARWEDETDRNDLLKIARALESEPSIVGASAHLLGVGRKAR